MNKKINHYLTLFQSIEPYFFYLILAVHLLPVLLFKTFPTVDGPAHLYNSKLIFDLLMNSKSELHHYFTFNPNLSPNWSGHFILSGLLMIFPTLIAEKIVLLSYLIFFPISFRFLFKKLDINEIYMLYFIFPFTYSFLFFYGFYNFHIGLVVLFFTLGAWVQALNSGINFKKSILLAVLSLLVFFSHLFVFTMLVAVIGFINLDQVFSFKRNQVKENKRILFRILLQFLILLPGIVLTFVYFYHQPKIEGGSIFLSAKELWLMIQQCQPAKGINYGKEDVFTKWIFILFIVILVNLIIKRLINRNLPINRKAIVWAGISFLVLIGLFILPDSAGAMGFFSSRLVLFFFLFFIIFLATQKVSLFTKIIAFVIINYVSIALLNIYVRSVSEMNQVASEIIEVSNKIEPYSTVYPINDSRLSHAGHFSNYLGINKPIVIIENYEASLSYFPLQWNHEKIPFLHLGDFQLIKSDLFTKNFYNQQTIDYVFILKDAQSMDVGPEEKRIERQLNLFYQLEFRSPNNRLKLYKKI